MDKEMFDAERQWLGRPADLLAPSSNGSLRPVKGRE